MQLFLTLCLEVYGKPFTILCIVGIELCLNSYETCFYQAMNGGAASVSPDHLAYPSVAVTLGDMSSCHRYNDVKLTYSVSKTKNLK